MSTAPSSDNQVPNADNAVPIPPEERFWQRYSPHHEFPLSSVASICLYGLGVLLAWAVIVFAMKQNEDYAPLPMEPIAIGGGGGSELGEGTVGPGDRPVAPKDVTRDVKPEETPTPNVAVNEAKLDDVTPDPLTLPEIKELDSRIIEDSSSAVAALSKVSVDARKQLFRGLGPVSKGKGGSGEGGGKGSGKGTGEGSGTGPGKGTLNVREKRVLRWKMIFNTINGNDYLSQLRELGAILAIPDPAGGGYLVIRDLRHLPAQGQKENLDKIQRIFWIDNQPHSVAALSRALQLRDTPPHIIAFFPESLEKELLDKELRFRGRREDQIKETQFRVKRRGGTYEPVVERQD
jgi:hypothetical protein